jgi:Mg-chelatase subunit ChlD
MSKCDKCENKVVDILCILDRSGSMSGIMEEAIGAFNEFVNEQKKLEGTDARLTLVTFDNRYDVLFDKVDIKEVRELTIDDASPRGMTALNDAIGKAINSVDNNDVVLLIQTDGYENASREYNTTQIKELIDKKKGLGWDISFIGADVDAFAAGANYGILADKCLNIDKTVKGMTQYRSLMSANTTLARS